MSGVALVTGGSGFIAAHLIPALVDQGWRVRTCGRRGRPQDLPAGVEYQQVDLAEGSGLDSLYDGVTRLFHLAGASSTGSTEEQMHRSNVVATENLLGAASRHRLERVLHMSSTSVYGEEVQLPVPVPEDVQPTPSRGYGKAKWMAEQVVWRFAAEGLPVQVVRPVSVYGPGNIKLLGSAILDASVEAFGGLGALAVHSKPVEQRLVHIEDLVAACLHLVDHGPLGRAFNVTCPTYPSSHDLVGILADQTGLSVELSDDPDCGPSHDQRLRWWDEMRAKGMEDRIVLTKERFRLMRKENRNNRLSIEALLGTGFEFRRADLAAGVADTFAWYRDHRWIL